MMDFTFDETQASLQSLARQIFETHATHDRVKELEAGSQSFDLDLWRMLERSGLLSVGIDEGGFLEQCVVLIEQGRTVAPVPLWSHLVAGAMVGSGDGILTLALEGEGVPALEEATALIAEVGGSLVRIDPKDVSAERRDTTAGFPEYEVALEGVRSEPLSGDSNELRRKAIVAICAIGVGVAERALEMTAAYTTERKQFDRPLGSFQAVQQRAADAYIDVEAMRTTMWQAAWRLSEGLEAEREVRIAKFWAAEGGQRVVSAAQHLHGGMGADVDYPLHRYTRWAKWVELAFGGATSHLAAMGQELAR